LRAERLRASTVSDVSARLAAAMEIGETVDRMLEARKEASEAVRES
jgi:hypothetical protein